MNTEKKHLLLLKKKRHFLFKKTSFIEVFFSFFIKHHVGFQTMNEYDESNIMILINIFLTWANHLYWSSTTLL